jgi:LmbE family N-acetylglucosaminyl deacetylase
MKPVLGIFSHPDDEVFGPGGTLALLAKEREVYLVCVTDGRAGINESDGEVDLAEVRKNELIESAKVLGIREVYFLDYADGSLSNSMYHEVLGAIKKVIDEVEPEILLTFEPQGVTGHIDHIAVSMITSYLFEKTLSVKELWQFCLTEEKRKAFGDYYIYFPLGYKSDEISREVNVSSVWEKKITAINKYESQKSDMERLLALNEKFPKTESFIIRKR